MKELNKLIENLTHSTITHEPDYFILEEDNPSVEDNTYIGRQKRALIKSIEKDGFYEIADKVQEKLINDLVISIIESI